MMTVIFAVMLIVFPFVFTVGGSAFSGGFDRPEKIRLLLTDTGEITEISMEDYVTGCLFAQIPVDYEEEALKAQAVCAYTYALRIIRNNKDNPAGAPENADISDSGALYQPYFTEEKAREYYGSDYDKYIEKVKNAAKFGVGHVITYENQPIYAVYHSVSTGDTNSALYVWGIDLPYLVSVPSPPDKEYHNYLCTNEMTTESVRAALLRYSRDIAMPIDYSEWFTENNTNEKGYVISVKVGDKTLSGGEVWRIFGLRSTAFSVSFNGNVFTFTTKGYGHGAGMSQYGANEMARSGKDWEEILRYYYTGVKII